MHLSSQSLFILLIVVSWLSFSLAFAENHDDDDSKLNSIDSQPQRRLFGRHVKYNATKTSIITTPTATPTKVPGHNVTQIWCSTSTKKKYRHHHHHRTLKTVVSCKQTVVFIPATKTKNVSSKATPKTAQSPSPHHHHKAEKSKHNSSTNTREPAHKHSTKPTTTTKTKKKPSATKTSHAVKETTATKSGSTLSTTPHSGSQVHPASQTSATSSSSTTGPLVSAYSDDHSKATPTDAVQDPNQPVDNNNGNGGTNVASNNNNDGNVSTGNDNSNNNGGSNGDSSNYNNSNKDSSDNSNSNVNSNSSDDNNSNDGDGDSSSDADNTTNSEQAPGSLPSPALVGTPASTPNGGDPNGDGNGGINETQAVSGNMSNKTLGIGLGLGIGCVAAVGLAGLLVHNRRKHQDQLASSRSLAGEEDPNVSTRWRPQSFMGVVASVVAKLPRSPSLRSNVSGGRNGNGHVRASTAGMAIGTGEGALESPTHTLGRHPSAASSRSAASQPPSLARVDGHPQDMHEVDLRY